MKKESEQYILMRGILERFRDMKHDEKPISLQPALELMRNHHKYGEKYYWILYYSYLSPKPCDNDERAISLLSAHGFDVTKRNFLGRRRAAIYAISECFFAIRNEK